MSQATEPPAFFEMLRRCSPEQLCELIEAIGVVCCERDWGPAINAQLGTCLLRAAVNMYESKKCVVELCIQSPHWTCPTYYKTGHGAVAGDQD